MIYIVRLMVFTSLTMMFILIGIMGYLQIKTKKGQTYNGYGYRRKRRSGGFLDKVYQVFYGIPLTKGLLVNIRLKIEVAGNYGDSNVKRKAAGLMLLLTFIYISFILLFWGITKDLVLLLVFSFILLFIVATLIDMYTGHIKLKLLSQQIDYMEKIRHNYYETRMIDDAFYEATQELSKNEHEIFIQGNRIHDVLSSKEIETEVLRYYETAPNKYLRMLLGFAYITKEYGDTMDEGGSVFIKNLSHLGKEVKMELAKLEKLNYSLKSLNFITLAPLFFINPVRNWASSNFIPLKVFYQSKWGVILEIMMIALVFLSFILLRKIQNNTDLNSEVSQSGKWISFIYEKTHKIVDFFLPDKHSSKWRKKEKLIQASASHESIPQLYTKKCLFALIGFVLAIVSSWVLHQSAITYELNRITLPKDFLGGDLNDVDKDKALALTGFDREIILETNRSENRDIIAEAIISRGIIDSVEIETGVERIGEKIHKINAQYFKWYELVIGFLMAVIGFAIPEIMHYLQKNIRKMDVEDEITAFNSIILMLMHHKRVDVEDILEWMEMYSRIFKPELQACLNSLAKGMDEALVDLKMKITHSQLVKIIDGLILAAEDLSLEEAFDELESDKSYYQDLRKEANERITSRKINLGNMVGFIPLYGIILLYMIVPMIVVSFSEMNHYFTQLK